MQQSRNPSEDPRVSELLTLLKQLIPSSPTLGLHDSDYLKSSLNSSKTVCDTVLIDIIKKNNFDQDRCIDAALIFYDSLTSNERISKNEKSQYSPVANQLQTQILSGDSNFGYNKPTSKVPSSSISYGKVLAVEPPPLKVKPRGSQWTLPETFLRAPRFRYFVTIESNFAIFFTVIYRRTAHADRMGLSIGNVEWESVVLNLHSKGPYDPFPVKESGVEVGDVLLGIDSEYFCPAAEVPDIIEMLNLLWQKRNSFVSLHFMRLKSYIPYLEQNKTKILNERDLLNQYVPIHPAITYLTEQGVIDRKQVRCVDTYLQRMKDRAINWDTQAVADRMGKWNLDVHFKDIDSNSLLKLPNFLWDKSLSGNSLSLSGQSKRKGPVLGDTDSDSNNALNAHLRRGSFLRPAISVTLLKADEQVDCVMYVLRVIDIRSGVDWVVRRRFREFFELREQLISVRSSVESIEFPVKRLNVIENHVVVGERMKLLQIFLRRLTGIVCVNTLHPSTSRMLLIFQRFLNTEAQMESILHQEGNFEVLPVRMAQVFIHSILQMSVMDKVLCGFIESFIQDRDVDSSNREWTDSDGVAALEEMRKFLDHLQGFFIDCFHADCAEIVTHFTQKSRRISACSVQMLSNMASDSPSPSSSPYPSPLQRHREKVSTDSEVMKFISEDELRSVISSAVRKQIEIEVYLPCSSRLTSLLDKAYFKREKNVRHIISCIVNQPQSFYGIPVGQISPSSWESIVSNLKEIRSKSLPFERIDCLLSVAKEIPTVYRFEHPDLSRQQEPDQQHQQQPQPQQQCLGADDILPVFIYILVRAQIPNLLALNQELQTLCDSERRMSEAGYYLATLEASIQHISEANIDKVFNNAARYGGSRSSSVDRDTCSSNKIPLQQSLYRKTITYMKIRGGSGENHYQNYTRPEKIELAIRNNNTIFYFGVGSNMLKSKVIERGLNGKKIEILSFRPGFVKNYRLAFNLRGFPPLEPAMGGIEPCTYSVAEPVRECHGSLIEMTASEYQKLWLSEGGGQATPGYAEIMVPVHPYHANGTSVEAVALRAADHVRLSRDSKPSLRYMRILLKGARELQLDSKYIHYLENIETSKPSKVLVQLSLLHIKWMFWLRRLKISWLPTLMSRILWTLYDCSSRIDDRVSSSGEGRRWIGCTWAWIQRICVDCMVVSVLLPGAIAWTVLQLCLQGMEWCRMIGSRITGNSVVGGEPSAPSPPMFKINVQDYL